MSSAGSGGLYFPGLPIHVSSPNKAAARLLSVLRNSGARGSSNCAGMVSGSPFQVEYPDFESGERKFETILCVLSEQGVEVSVIGTRQRGRFEDKQVLIIRFGVLREVIAAGDYRLVVDDHHFVVHEIVRV